MIRGERNKDHKGDINVCNNLEEGVILSNYKIQQDTQYLRRRGSLNLKNRTEDS